jgi:Fe-S-cluster containining protein
VLDICDTLFSSLTWHITCKKRCKLNAAQQVKNHEVKLLNKHDESLSNFNLCKRCGACCATWKVCFPAIEVDTRNTIGVPIEFTVPLSETRLAMKGTELRQKRCCALKGQIGSEVSCSIYPFRPTVCQVFKASWEIGVSNHSCDRARTIYGLVPFGSLMPFGGM